MKFVVDQMYHRLARWLRMLGYDAVYNQDFVDQDFILLAKEENRIILTRDEDLKRRAQKLGLQAVTIDAPTIEERLIILQKELGVELALPEKILPRCTICNSEIRVIDSNEILDQISELTQLHYKEFWICKNPGCSQIYWRGSHWEKMGKTLKDCREMIELDKSNKD
ncbi:MAG: Mut7-C RNAse domain-containing protein [Candidatus Heimdallarchaeota archaeon]|nr:Mut7-C RNAse domain-containing protein [Candidatus Heimdallarchaeota archaeon]MCK4290851.1 Mut7-C RNAse domain-containing protein [Candidatus Heimdallarchaeota archaeon]